MQFPKKFDMKDATPIDQGVPAKFDMTDTTPITDTISATPGPGTYKMYKDGKEFDVEFGNVDSASQRGFTSNPKDALRYLKDKAFKLKTDNKNKYLRPALNALPTLGGILGGMFAAGGAAETGPGAIIAGTVGAGVGGAGGEDVRQMGQRYFFNEGPKTVKDSAKEIAKQGAIQAGSELTGRVIGKAINPAVTFFGDTAEASEKAGVRMLPSEAAGKAPSYAEKFLKGSVLTSGAMEKFRSLQNTETQSAVEKIAQSISKSRGTPEELGDLVKKGIDSHKVTFRSIQKMMYDDIKNDVGERVIRVPTSKQVPSGLLDASGNPITKTVTTFQDKVVDNVMPSTVDLKKFAAEELKRLDLAEQIVDPSLLKQSRTMLERIASAPDNVPFSAMKDARSDYLVIARQLDQALEGKASGFAKKMASLYDEAMMDAAQKSGIPGLVDKVRAANKLTADEHEMFEQALVKKIVETKKPEAIASLIRGKNIGLQETRDLFKILPPQLHAPVQRQIILDTMRQSTNNISKVFNERKFAEVIAGLGDERGTVIFGKNWKNVKGISKIMEQINGPVGMGGGSGAALQNLGMIKEITAALAAIPIGLVSAGHYEGGTLVLAGQVLSFKAAAYAMTHPKIAEKIMNALRIGIQESAHGPGLVYNESGGNQPAKSWDELKKKSEELMKPKAAAAPPTPEATPAPLPPVIPAASPNYDPDADIEPQSKAKPYTHIFDPSTGTIVAA